MYCCSKKFWENNWLILEIPYQITCCIFLPLVCNTELQHAPKQLSRWLVIPAQLGLEPHPKHDVTSGAFIGKGHGVCVGSVQLVLRLTARRFMANIFYGVLMPGKDITWFAGKSSIIINDQGCLNGEITYKLRIFQKTICLIPKG